MTPDELLALVETVTRDPEHVLTLPVPMDGEDAPETAYLLLSGAVDLLAEQAGAAGEELRGALRTVLAAEPVFRSEIHDLARRAEELERAARMRGREIAMSEGWLVPRLRREIRLYEQRIAALEPLTEEMA